MLPSPKTTVGRMGGKGRQEGGNIQTRLFDADGESIVVGEMRGEHIQMIQRGLAHVGNLHRKSGRQRVVVVVVVVVVGTHNQTQDRRKDEQMGGQDMRASMTVLYG